ncbi:MAG: sigma-70 family RNA polymerase sigma factor [Oscillospiraceae bacterium]|nr:sigma-70 family RNA polymerase sigma factor [Oscillospiraceae bacterium]
MDFQTEYDKLYRYCYCRLGHRETAEDTAQEAIVRFLEHPEYAGTGRERQYLYTIARNLCTDVYRRETALPLDEISAAQDSGEEAWLTHVALALALHALSEEDRELIVLRYISDVPVRTLAAMHGVSWFSMNRRIKRILRTMRDTLGEEGAEWTDK